MKNGAPLIVLALMLAGCNSGGPSSVPATPPVSGWVIQYSPSVPAGTPGNGFAFPAAVGGEGHSDGVHYVVQRSPPVAPGQTITMRFRLDGEGVLHPTEGDSPEARVRLFLQRAGDTLTAAEPYKRWWSVASVVLISPSEFTLSARIAPEEWSSVFGARGDASQETTAGFTDCIGNLAYAGYTFGGVFAGHGVYADGPVNFTLIEYTVQ